MNIRTYTAESMAGALARVKRELGPDAVILHTRTMYRGGFLGLGRKMIVEITASNDVRVAARPKRAEPQRAVTSQPQAVAQPVASRAPLLQKAYGGSVSGGVNVSGAAVAVAEAPATFGQAVKSGAVPFVVNTTEADPRLAEEMKQIRQMVHRVMRKQGGGPAEMPEALMGQYLEMIEHDVAELASVSFTG